ncbi:hypothetical protein PO909_026705 [Leuciscus waleckii]
MMVYQKTESSEEFMKMDIEYERKTTFSKGCSRKTGIFVLLGTIMIIMTFVIFCHQQRTFSVLENWMNIHSSNQTSVNTDLQITVQEKNIETLMTNLASSLSSITFKLEENQQKLERQQGLSHTEVKSLMNSLSLAVSALTSKLNDAESLSRSLSVLKSSVSDLTSSVASLSSKQQISEERVMNALKELKSNMKYKKADVPVTCKSAWILYKSSCFLFSNNKLNWAEARDYCKAQGALLLKIEEDEEEWEFLNNHTIPEHYWVGLTDQNTGQWRWADDTPYTMNKERWAPGQPDDWEGHGLGEKGEDGEDCGQFIFTGKLNDNHCSSKMRFICRV